MVLASTKFFETALLFPALEPDFTTTMAQVYEYATDAAPSDVWRFGVFPYRRQTTPRANLQDDLHLEPLQANKTFQEYSFSMHIAANPKQSLLTKFGLDVPRELIVYMALPVLEEQALVVQVNKREFVAGIEQDVSPATKDSGPLLFLTVIGDRIGFQGHQYEILEIHEDQFFGTEIPVWLVATCNKWQPDTTTDASLTDVTDEWRADDLNPQNAVDE